jgi:hypothetical protein
MCKKKDSKNLNFDDMYMCMQPAPSVQNVMESATSAHYDSLCENGYLDAVFSDMKALFNECDFKSRRNEQEEIHGTVGIMINEIYWPVTPSQKFNIGEGFKIGMTTNINFYIPQHNMLARYEGSFGIKNAVIRARFAGDERCHCFYIGEHDKLSADVLISSGAEESPMALMMDRRIPEAVMAEIKKLREQGNLKDIAIERDAAELEEFYMLALTNGRYYKNYMEPRDVGSDLAIFTCYNKARNVLCDTVASFTHGLCDPESIFTDTRPEDVRASWAVGKLFNC